MKCAPLEIGNKSSRSKRSLINGKPTEQRLRNSYYMPQYSRTIPVCAYCPFSGPFHSPSIQICMKNYAISLFMKVVTLGWALKNIHGHIVPLKKWILFPLNPA
jgi:hypothetical protein